MVAVHGDVIHGEARRRSIDSKQTRWAVTGEVGMHRYDGQTGVGEVPSCFGDPWSARYRCGSRRESECEHSFRRAGSPRSRSKVSALSHGLGRTESCTMVGTPWPTRGRCARRDAGSPRRARERPVRRALRRAHHHSRSRNARQRSGWWRSRSGARRSCEDPSTAFIRPESSPLDARKIRLSLESSRGLANEIVVECVECSVTSALASECSGDAAPWRARDAALMKNIPTVWRRVCRAGTF